MDRRSHLKSLAVLGLSALTSGRIEMDVLKRTIPSTGEPIPVVGLGTWQTFDASPNEYSPLREVLKNLAAGGCSVVDSSPMYGRSEETVGTLSTELGLNKSLFMATKVWTQGKENGVRQMNESLSLLQRKSIDLMQIHNLTDWKTHLPTLRQWKESGKIRYIGITHYTESAYPQMEAIMNSVDLDFIQVNYSILSRGCEKRILPLAQEKKIAVLINRPFEEGAVFKRVKGMTLPDWCAETEIRSWGQFFLKFILSNPAVTCVIPGTANPRHMLDNSGAAIGKLPTENQKMEMIKVVS